MWACLNNFVLILNSGSNPLSKCIQDPCSVWTDPHYISGDKQKIKNLFLVFFFFSSQPCRIADCRILEYPTEVRLEWIHNHGVSIPAALKFRKDSNDTCKKLEDLFSNGHSPSSALNLLELELQTEDPENYVLACGDRSICPDLPFCYRSVIHFVE